MIDIKLTNQDINVPKTQLYRLDQYEDWSNTFGEASTKRSQSSSSKNTNSGNCSYSELIWWTLIAFACSLFLIWTTPSFV